MLKRDEISNPSSCLNRAADDEPLFVFRANDELAPLLLRSWATFYERSKRDAQNSMLTEAQRMKILEARVAADKMEEWRHTRGMGLPQPDPDYLDIPDFLRCKS